MTYVRQVVNMLLFLPVSNCVLVSFVWLDKPAERVLFYIASALALLFIVVYPVRADNTVIRLRSLRKGHALLVLFSVGSLLNLAVTMFSGIFLIPDTIGWWVLAVNAAVCLPAALVLLLAGLSRVFLTSQQLGVKRRILLFFFWWVPVVNYVLLAKVCRLIRREYAFETLKNELNQTRKEKEICKTKYPLLLVHGVFFRDFRYFGYWGRIPKELKKNGAEIYFGQQQSAASVRDSAQELAQRIAQIVSEAGCERVNIIAHSKGGLDARYAISRLGADKYVASLTTINTPHRGCIFADRLLDKASEKLKRGIARKYNAAMKRLGDQNPDFLAAVTDLTAARCKILNDEAPDKENVYYQSVASKMNSWTDGKFPLNLSHLLVRAYDGENDGLVSVESARWGSRCRVIVPPGKRGVSHGDMIDLNRENIDGFDVRELYVDIVSGLKSMGM